MDITHNLGGPADRLSGAGRARAGDPAFRKSVDDCCERSVAAEARRGFSSSTAGSFDVRRVFCMEFMLDDAAIYSGALEMWLETSSKAPATSEFRGRVVFSTSKATSAKSSTRTEHRRRSTRTTIPHLPITPLRQRTAIGCGWRSPARLLVWLRAGKCRSQGEALPAGQQ